MGRRCVAPYPTRPTRPLEHSHCRANPTRTFRVHCEHILMWSECTGRTRRSVYMSNPTRTVRERFARRVKLSVCTRPMFSVMPDALSYVFISSRVLSGDLGFGRLFLESFFPSPVQPCPSFFLRSCLHLFS